MNIIVCNDQRIDVFPEAFDWLAPGAAQNSLRNREAINMDTLLIKRLRRKGHKVSLFDGYKLDAVTKITSPNQGASVLAELIVTEEATGMVFDLHYFDDFNYGMTMLRDLQRTSSLPIDMILIIYSRFTREVGGDYPRRLVEECRIPLGNVIDRNMRSIDFIVDLFKKRPTP